MSKTFFTIESKKRFAASEWSWLLLALRQDDVVWRALEDEDFCCRAFKAFPAKAVAWSPAALAVLALDDNITVETIVSENAQPMDENITKEASQVYEDWIRNPTNPTELRTAALLCLTLLGQFRVSGSWRDLLSMENLYPEAAATPFACLYGMIPHPMNLVRELFQAREPGWVHLGVHVLLANPIPPELQLTIFKNLSEDLGSSNLSLLLTTLATARPNLAGLLAKQLVEHPPKPLSTTSGRQKATDIIQQLETMLESLRMTQVHQIAGQADLAVPILAENLRMIRKMRGQLSAQMARAVSQTQDISSTELDSTAQSTSIEAWKQAVQMSPDEPRISAGFSRALARAGKQKEALRVLKTFLDDETHAIHPELLLTYALILDQEKEYEKATQTAIRAAELLGEGHFLGETDAARLVRFFLAKGKLHHAIDTLRFGLLSYPTSGDLLGLLANAQMKLGNPEEAAAAAYAAKASSEYKRDLPPKNSSDGDGFFEIEGVYGDKGFNLNDLQRTLVESLEAIQAWEPAYHERIALLSEMDKPTSADLYALGICAAAAKKFPEAIEIGKQLLHEDPQNLKAHQLLAEASEELGDYPTAIEYFNRIIQLHPEDGVIWRSLVRVQEKAGDHTGAIDTLRAAGQALPDDPQIQLELGETYLLQESPTLALPCLRRAYLATKGGEQGKLAGLRLGETLYQLGRTDEAREVLEPIFQQEAQITDLENHFAQTNTPPLNVNPELALAYARTLLSLGDAEKSVPILTQVVRDRPEDPVASIELVKSLMQLNDRLSGAKRALPFLQRMLGLGPNGVENGYTASLETNSGLRAQVRVLLAEAYAAVGEWEKAMEAFRKAMEEPANQEKAIQTRLSVGLGLTALKLELPEMAVAALQDAAQAEPLNLQVHRNLSEAYLTNGLAQDAFMTAKATLEIAPGDVDTLLWFADQGARIAAMDEVVAGPIIDEAIRALEAVLQKTPDRADALIRLGKALIQAGRRADALQVFNKLIPLVIDLDQVRLSELYQAGLEVLEAGDARLAVELFRKTASLAENIDPVSGPSREKFDLLDLYLSLVNTLQQLGDLQEALKAVNHALGLDNARVTLHTAKADILFLLGDTENARACLAEALQRWPEEIPLYHRMGRVLRAQGNLPEALQTIETGLTLVEKSDETKWREDMYHLAARYSFAALRPKRALAYFQKAYPETHPDYDKYENAILRAELAIEATEEQIASETIAAFGAQAAQSAAALAVCSRIACRNGEKDEANRTCRAAIRAWTKQQLNQPGQTPATSKDEFIIELSTIGMAALENREWDHALSVFRQMVEMFPEEPQARYKLALAYVLIAEAKVLSQDFDLVLNAPPQNSLLDNAYDQFISNLETAAAQTGTKDAIRDDHIPDDWDIEIKRSIGVCNRRGRACFTPSIDTAAALEALLQTMSPDVTDISALVMVYRRCGAKGRAIKSLTVGSKPIFDEKDPHSEPQIVSNLALSEEDPLKAIDLINKSMAIFLQNGMPWPEPQMFHYLLAKLYFALQDFNLAKDELEQALAVWPDEPRWQAFAAQLRLTLPSEDRSQQLADAMSALRKAAEQEPENGEHQLALGKVYLESGQYQQAVETLSQATRLLPQKFEGWFALAKAQNGMGDFEKAALSAERAIEQGEEQVAPLLLRAEIAMKTKNFRGAQHRAQAVLHLQPENAQAQRLLAQALAGLNKPNEALEVLTKAIPQSEDPLELQLQRLELIHQAQGLDEGLKALQELVAKNPKQAAYLALLANWLLSAGKQDAAVQAARLALQEGLEGLSEKQKANLHTMIGLHLRKSGQLDQAIHHLTEAITKDSDHIDAYLELGRVFQERREFQQALKVYQKAIHMTNGDYRPYYFSGVALKENKDYMAAEAMLRKAAQLAPKEVAVHRLLAAVVALNLVHGRRLISGDLRAD